VLGVLKGAGLRVYFVSETAQFELRSERVYASASQRRLLRPRCPSADPHLVGAHVAEAKLECGSSQFIQADAQKPSAVRVNLGSIWGQPGVDRGSTWGQLKVNLGSTWG
jgi:hypothetical protein